MKIELTIDKHKQWFVPVWVVIGKKKCRVEFKVDTGCNSLVISHSTLKSIGFFKKETELLKLPPVSGVLASGDSHTFRDLGTILLCQDKAQSIHLCKADAICHSTHETHDLLGTEVFKQFNKIFFSLVGDKYIELT